MVIFWADQWHKLKESPQQHEAPLGKPLRCPESTPSSGALFALEPAPEPSPEPPHGPAPVPSPEPSLDAAAATIPDLSPAAAVGKTAGFRPPPSQVMLYIYMYIYTPRTSGIHSITCDGSASHFTDDA